jgi:hypothetical protein
VEILRELSRYLDMQVGGRGRAIEIGATNPKRRKTRNIRKEDGKIRKEMT